MFSGTKEVLRQFLRRVDAVLVEIGHAVFREEIIVDEELPVNSRAGLLNTA